LLFPTIREKRGPRAVGWDEGLAFAAQRIRAVLEAGRKVGVLGSGRVTNEEAFLAVRLARDALRTPHLDTSLRSSYEALLQGAQPGGGLLDLDGILEYLEGCDLILLVEGDLAESHPQLAFLIMKALVRGARLVTLGPVRTRMSALARPHLFLDPTGPPEVPAELEEVLGDAGDLGEVALLLAPFTSDTARLRSMVGALVRRVGDWGGYGGPRLRALPLPLLANSRGAFEMGFAPGFLPGVRPADDPAIRARLMSAWGSEVQFEVGLGAEQMLGEVDGLVLLRENPPETQHAPGESLRALKSMECLVVLDAYRSPPAELATVTLPLGAFSETRGTLLSLDGLIQRWRPAHRAPGEAREGWRVLVDLLTVLGVHASYSSLTDVAEEMGRVIPGLPGGVAGEGGEPWAGRIPELRIPTEKAPILLGPEEGAGMEMGVRQPDSGGLFRMALVGSHAWADDLAVGLSPTLRRDGVSLRKLFPEGRLSMNRSDAESLGIRDGWRVWVGGENQGTEVPVSVSPDVEPGMLFAPFCFRDRFSGVLGGATEGRVTLQRR
jgi:predicted molibdopterin-dependent oxidoreductase YjgC